MIEYLLYMIVVLGGASLLVVMIAGITAFISTRSEGDFRLAFNVGLDFFVGTDNRRWCTLLAITLFTTVMALTHPGDGLVKPLEERAQEDPLRVELNEVRERHYNLREYGLYITNAEMCAESSDFYKKNQHICAPEKEKARSWVWWWEAATFWILLLLYTIPAFWDDVMRAGRRTYARLRAQAGGEARFRPGSLIDRLFGRRGRPGRRSRLSLAPAPEAQVPPQAPAPAQPQHAMNFWSVMVASLIPEIFVNILEWFTPRRRRG